MTKMEMALLFGNMGAGAIGSAVNARQNNKNQAQSELDAMVQRQLAALQNNQQTSQNLQDQRQQGWKDQTSQSPLGQEQSYVQKQRLAQVLFPQLANFKPAMPTDAGVAGAYQAPTNFLSVLNDPRLMATFDDDMTATALADRRKLMAGLNPDYEFSSLSNYGLDSSFDDGVSRAQQDAVGRRQAYEDTQTDLANQQYALASQQSQQGAQGEKKKGSSIWSKLGKVAKVAVPVVLAATGVGAPAAAAIMAGTYAASKKADGGSWGDALKSGVIGGATGAVGAGALGSGAKAGLSAGTQKIVAQGALSGLDAKVGGGSWGDALGSAATGAATAKAQQWAGGRFNNGPSLNNDMTAASFPTGSGFSAPQTSLNVPSKAWDMTKIVTGGMQGNNPAQQVGSAGGGAPRPQPNMGQQPTGNAASGFNSQGYPLAAAGPYTGPGSTTGSISSIPNGSVAGLDFMAQLQQQPFVQALNSPVGAIAAGAVGASRPGQSMGPMQSQLGAGPQFSQLGAGAQPKFVGSGATPQALAGGRQMLQLGAGPQMSKALPAGQYEMGPIGSTSAPRGSTFNLPKFSPSNMENQQNAMNIINQLSKMPKDQAAAFLATPQGQAILQQLPRAASPYAGLSPQQMMQMVVRGGG